MRRETHPERMRRFRHMRVACNNPISRKSDATILRYSVQTNGY
jgi:hypothetical protein